MGKSDATEYLPPSQDLNAQDVSYTSPLGLHSRMRVLPIQLDVVPILDLCAIALLFSLLFTRYVVTPGVRVELPQTTLEMQHSARAVAVLTIQNKGMLFFDGAVYELNTIQRGLEKYLVRTARYDAVLLIKAEADLSLQAFLDLCQMARDAGFDQIQISGDKPEAIDELFPGETVPDVFGGEAVPVT